MSWKFFATSILIQTLSLLVPTFPAAQQSGIKPSTPDQIEAEFLSVPCKNEERLGAAKSLFAKMGVPLSEISPEEFNHVENLVIRKEGTSKEVIVIGAHYDKTPAGCGALDNWTGIVTLAHVYKSLKNVPLKKTVLFVAFGKEEKGLLGSRAMAASIPPDQVGHYCAMINVDSLGIVAPQVDDSVSSKSLEGLAADLAREMKIPFGHAPIENAEADSSPFLRKTIPSVTIHGMPNEWATILHSQKDQPAKVNPMNVYLGYRLALAMVIRVDQSSCSAFR
ncbi:MAG: Zn-dependent exopeptidase M28 [Acidobacteriia bacterium]|nr:Zn-dependent exopeptidase M28 [Terriglobia bacterium]